MADPEGKKHRGDITEGKDKLGTCLYADDIVQWSEDATEIQRAAEVLAETLNTWGMRINAKKTKFQVIQPKNHPQRCSAEIYINGSKIEQVKEYKYLERLSKKQPKWMLKLNTEYTLLKQNFERCFRYGKTTHSLGT